MTRPSDREPTQPSSSDRDRGGLRIAEDAPSGGLRTVDEPGGRRGALQMEDVAQPAVSASRPPSAPVGSDSTTPAATGVTVAFNFTSPSIQKAEVALERGDRPVSLELLGLDAPDVRGGILAGQFDAAALQGAARAFLDKRDSLATKGASFAHLKALQTSHPRFFAWMKELKAVADATPEEAAALLRKTVLNEVRRTLEQKAHEAYHVTNATAGPKVIDFGEWAGLCNFARAFGLTPQLAETAAQLACRKVTGDESWTPPLNPAEAARLAEEDARRQAEEAEAKRREAEGRVAVLEAEKRAAADAAERAIEAQKAAEAEREVERNAAAAQKLDLERIMGGQYAELVKESAVFLACVEAEGGAGVPSSRAAYEAGLAKEVPRSEAAQRWHDFDLSVAQLRTLEVRIAGAGGAGQPAHARILTALGTAPEVQRRLARTTILQVSLGRARTQKRLIAGLALLASGLTILWLLTSMVTLTGLGLTLACLLSGALLTRQGFDRARAFRTPVAFAEMVAQAPEGVGPARGKAWRRRALYATPALVACAFLVASRQGLVRPEVRWLEPDFVSERLREAIVVAAANTRERPSASTPDGAGDVSGEQPPEEPPTDASPTEEAAAPAAPDVTEAPADTAQPPVAEVPLEMVRIEPGTFMMGSPRTEPLRSADELLHSVTITRAFFLSRTEVTQGQWMSVMGTNPSVNQTCGPNCPVESVSWVDAVAYLNALSVREGLTPCYDGVRFKGLGCDGYRLPTEAEWEYAARAGTSEGLRYQGPAASELQPVGQRAANPWGLQDMVGSVWEWVHDMHGPYPLVALDPIGPVKGGWRGMRGGSFTSELRHLRVANRGAHPKTKKLDNLGLRVARSGPVTGSSQPPYPGTDPAAHAASAQLVWAELTPLLADERQRTETKQAWLVEYLGLFGSASGEPCVVAAQEMAAALALGVDPAAPNPGDDPTRDGAGSDEAAPDLPARRDLDAMRRVNRPNIKPLPL
jgi:formylglycine-generating enzyme required for sulfatase activity